MSTLAVVPTLTTSDSFLRRQVPAVSPKPHPRQSRFRPRFMCQKCRFNDQRASLRNCVLLPRILGCLQSLTTARPLCQALHFPELSLPMCGRFRRIIFPSPTRRVSHVPTLPSYPLGTIRSRSRPHESIRGSVTVMGSFLFHLYLLCRQALIARLLVDLRVGRARARSLRMTTHRRPGGATRMINCCRKRQTSRVLAAQANPYRSRPFPS